MKSTFVNCICRWGDRGECEVITSMHDGIRKWLLECNEFIWSQALCNNDETRQDCQEVILINSELIRGHLNYRIMLNLLY